jgi:transcription elongation GreA/GreB family factor
MARALLKRRIDDQIAVDTPGGRISMVVLEVSFIAPE